MVALAVVSIGLVALSKALTQRVEIAQQLELRTVASWVASNRMAELRMNRRFSASGSNINHQQMAGISWRIVDNFFATPDPNIARVVVEVFTQEVEIPLSSNIGYLARHKPAKL